MLRVKQLPTFDAVSAGRKAVVDLTLGLRYHAIWLVIGNNAGVTGTLVANTIPDLVDDVVLKINGKAQRTHTAAELNALNGINGAAYVAKATGVTGEASRRHYLPIWFAQPWRKTQSEVDALALRANGIQSLQLEVNVHAGLTAPIVGGFFEYDYDSREIGLISKVGRQDVSAAGTSKDITSFEKREFIESIHLFPTVGGTSRYVSALKLTANGEELRDRITHLENQASLLGRELVPDVTSVPRYDLVLDYDDPINGSLNATALRELTLKVEWNDVAAGTMPIIIQRTGPPE